MSSLLRKRIRVEGIVQGVGFRPFIYRIATERNLNGSVCNDSQGVMIHIEGPTSAIGSFLSALRAELPPLASIRHIDIKDERVTGQKEFVILESRDTDARMAQISPDTHVCPDCLRELYDPLDRRYRYPFINCTNCGPRYSIVTGIPYDRPLTTMVDFPMCATCRREYEDPLSRRFHAQPNACPECGPRLSLRDATGRVINSADPLSGTISLLKEGQIVAVKGLGGYHLAVDATNTSAVERLRQRKLRDEKPFALMTYDLDRVKCFAHVSALEKRMLSGTERPIVLLEQLPDSPVSPLVAPGNRFLGVMLPYTPLHFLLLEPFAALVMTSGNQTDEPIAYDDQDARSRLEGIADAYLVHNRRIHIRTDDSIVRSMAGEPLMLRRSRGYVPREIRLSAPRPPVLAVGAELKNTICLTRGDQAFLSHHIGDLKNQEVADSQRQAIAHLMRVLEVEPQAVAHDLHPDYLSTRVAESLTGIRRIAVQHHHAHLASCMAENGVEEKTLGVIFDGIGYGSDGHIWGGEFLLGDFRQFERVGHLAYLPMPGGDAATKEPWRMAVSYLTQAFGDDLPEEIFPFEIKPADLKLLKQMIKKRLNSPLTSSCGRLFDAVAALAGLRDRVSYEGQAALELEMALDDAAGQESGYPMSIHDVDGILLVETMPLIRALVDDLRDGINSSQISARFHNGISDVIVAVCGAVRKRFGPCPVALSGGVFQNRYLTERTLKLLKQDGFEVLVHRQVPPNDGGLALGQAVIASAAP